MKSGVEKDPLTGLSGPDLSQVAETGPKADLGGSIM